MNKEKKLIFSCLHFVENYKKLYLRYEINYS